MRNGVEIEDDIRLLPIWLDYHKHIFDSGVVVFDDDANIIEVQHIVSRFFPEWTFHKTRDYPISSSQYLEDETTGNSVCSIFLSSNEFLLNSNKSEIAEYYKYKNPVKVNTVIESANNSGREASAEQRVRGFSAHAVEDPWGLRRENREVPNNVIDFVSNLSFSYEGNSFKEVRLLLTYPEYPTCEHISTLVYQRRKELESSDYIYYLDAYVYSNYNWGEDRVILQEDTNLLENTDFNKDGHSVFKMNSYTDFLQSMVAKKIANFMPHTSRILSDISKYHSNITDEEHTKIINAMPWKKTESPEIQEFAEYMESRVSGILGKKVRIFNDDIWVRICRPSSVTDTDYNPCHRDIYLDFYRNIVNIYVPIVGSNDKSSLAMQSGSHLWNESDLVVTKGGAYFPSSGKKYSVDAILRSKQPLDMVRPNPREDEFILFSPYLIHGCSSNNNVDTTRMSVEIRFIADDESAKMQEGEFTKFLKERVWR
jgi:hypothetical protein